MLALASWFTLCAAARQLAGATTPFRDGGPCVGTRSDTVVITDKTVAGMPLDASMDSLRQMCPMAHDTTVPMGSGRAHPGLTFPLAARVVALQNGLPGAGLKNDRGPDGWLIVGAAALPDGVTLDTRWRELKAVLGPHQVNAGDVVVVRFCKLPRFLFTLTIDGDAVRLLANGNVDERSIPADTKIHHLTILSGTMSAALMPCH